MSLRVSVFAVLRMGLAGPSLPPCSIFIFQLDIKFSEWEMDICSLSVVL